jgi:hypothetical protein
MTLFFTIDAGHVNLLSADKHSAQLKPSLSRS